MSKNNYLLIVIILAGLFALALKPLPQSTNTPPVVTEAQIMPLTPTTNDMLQLTYIYTDAEGDLEGDTQIRWYVNSALQSSLNNQTTVSSTFTLPGEVWYATIQPHDGFEYGEVVTTNAVTIIDPNHPPQLLEVQITPITPTISDTLQLTYVYSDPDGDLEGDTEIRWYRNDFLQPNFNDRALISATATSFGEVWYATVRPHDGNEYGSITQSNMVNIPWPVTVYLPLMKTVRAAACSLPYGEPNDSRSEACLIQPGVIYQAYHEDRDDIYKFVVTETSRVRIEVENYIVSSTGGQLLIYDAYDQDNVLPYGEDRDLAGNSELWPQSRGSNRRALVPGTYYIRIFTYPQDYQTEDNYTLRIVFE